MPTIKSDINGTPAQYRRARYGWQRQPSKQETQCSQCRHFDDMTKKSYCHWMECETLKTALCGKYNVWITDSYKDEQRLSR